MRPRLLDLFCGAGGAAKGYYDALDKQIEDALARFRSKDSGDG